MVHQLLIETADVHSSEYKNMDDNIHKYRDIKNKDGQTEKVRYRAALRLLLSSFLTNFNFIFI